MKKPMIKALALSLAFTMALSTPAVASAEGIADVFSATEESTTTTDTSTNTDTNTNTNTGSDVGEDDTVVDKEDYAKVVGIVLDSEDVTVEVEKSATLTATILIAQDANTDTDAYTSMSVNELVAAEDMIVVFEGEEVSAADLAKKLVWTADSEIVEVTDNNDGTATVKGAAMGWTAVTAKLGDVYEATAAVTVKKYANSIKFVNAPEVGYVKHNCVNLNDYIEMDGNDRIMWNVFQLDKKGNRKVSKAAVISADGQITYKKVAEEIIIVAVTEKGKSAEHKMKIEKGTPATKITTADSKKIDMTVTVDEMYPAKNVSVAISGKKGAVSTDCVKWFSNKGNIAWVEGDGTNAVIHGLNPGKAVITAKTTSGEILKFNVTVKAPLTAINAVVDEDGNTAGTIYAGQKIQLFADKTPFNSNDKVTFKIESQTAKLGAKINKNTGVITTKPGKTGEVTVIATGKNSVTKEKLTSVEKYVLTIAESKVEKITIVDAEGKAIADSSNNKLKTTTKLYTTKAYDFDLDLLPVDVAVDEMVTWSTNKAKVASVDKIGYTKAIKNGKATITATSYNGKKKVTAKTTVQVVQPARAIEVNKTEFTANPGTKKLVLQVKKQLPKGANDTITWSIVSDETEKASFNKTTGNKVNLKFAGLSTDDLGKKIVVKATATSGASKLITVNVCSTTKKVKFTTGTKMDTTIGKELVIGEDVKADVELKNNTGDVKEVITYTANNSNVRIADGKIYVLKAGKTKITAMTASGNKAVLTLTIK